MGYIWIFFSAMMLLGAYSFYIPYSTIPWADSGTDIPQYVMLGSMILFMVIAVIFFLVGVGMVIRSYQRPKEIMLLKASGARIQGDIVHLEQVTNLRVNMRSPYRIHVRAKNPATGQEAIFVSDYIWTDPHLELQRVKTTTVYIDTINPKKYYVDIDFLKL